MTTKRPSAPIKNPLKTQGKLKPGSADLASSVAKSTTKSVAKSVTKQRPTTVMGLPLTTWAGQLRRSKGAEVRSGQRGFLYLFASRDLIVLEKALKKTINKTFKTALDGQLNKWQLQSLLKSEAECVFFQGVSGPLWILIGAKAESRVRRPAALDKSNCARFRDLAGSIVGPLAGLGCEKLVIEMHGLSIPEQAAVVTGLEMASYTFRENLTTNGKVRKVLPKLLLKEGSISEREIQTAADLGLAVNIARHYTNLPASDLNPRTYAESVVEIFAKSKTVTVEVWEGEKLSQEKMGLLCAVGAAAVEGPRFVHLRYRPKSNAAIKPVAIVGKGITFDSGGLDLKPSSGMRLMKKDMGGSAAVVGLLKWAEQTELALPLDAYMSLAENAVGSHSFRPGDVLVARSGATVEISNTDAEGRLVLADALDVAVGQTADNKPSCVIDIATLTGAIKIGLGADIAGLFCNDEALSNTLFESGLATGDLMWQMPLYQLYRSQMKSPFAEMLNSAEGSFGGAITAALFLESYVRGIPWAHLDIYAWKDSASGAISEAGGNGQSVQALAHALTRMAEEKSGLKA
jgi:leucyl aminopeptidase